MPLTRPLYRQEDLNPADITAEIAAAVGVEEAARIAADLLLAPRLIDVTESTTARTLALTDAFKMIQLTHASGCSITIPQNGTIPFAVGDIVYFRRTTSAGAVAALSGSGVTVNDNLYTTVPAGGTFAIRKTATNTWDFI